MYECFKNSNRGLPDEFRVRKRKAAPSTSTKQTENDNEPAVPEKKFPDSYEELSMPSYLLDQYIALFLYWGGRGYSLMLLQ